MCFHHENCKSMHLPRIAYILWCRRVAIEFYLTHATLNTVEEQLFAGHSEGWLAHHGTKPHLHPRPAYHLSIKTGTPITTLHTRNIPSQHMITQLVTCNFLIKLTMPLCGVVCGQTFIGMVTWISPVFDLWGSSVTVNVCVSPHGKFFTFSNSALKPWEEQTRVTPRGLCS